MVVVVAEVVLPPKIGHVQCHLNLVSNDCAVQAKLGTTVTAGHISKIATSNVTSSVVENESLDLTCSEERERERERDIQFYLLTHFYCYCFFTKVHFVTAIRRAKLLTTYIFLPVSPYSNVES